MSEVISSQDVEEITALYFVPETGTFRAVFVMLKVVVVAPE